MNDMEEKIRSLRAILGNEIQRVRLLQILEASNGSLEHAIEIYFHQQSQPLQNEIENCDQINNIHREDNTTSSLVISVEDEVSGPIETPKKNHNPTAQETAFITSRKRSPNKISSMVKSSGLNGAKQARLDSFCKLDSKTHKYPLSNTSTVRKGATVESVRREEATEVKDLKNSNFDSSGENPPTLKSTSASLRNQRLGLIHDKQKRQVESCIHSHSFRRLCETLQELTDTTKRLIKLKALQTFMREIIDSNGTHDGNSIDISVRATTLSAALELILGGCTSSPTNVSGSAVSKALQISLGITRNQISKAYREFGDLGDCAASFFQKKTHFLVAPAARRPLSIIHVTEALSKISQTEGTNAKQHVVLGLLRACQSKIECRFIVRLLIRNMRIGANVKTVLAALAMAIVSCGNGDDGDLSTKNSKEAITLVQKTHDVCPDVSKIVRALLEGGFDQMQRDCSIQVMTPIAPMLAHPIHCLEEIKTKMGDDGDLATMEWKYDGMRCQAHFDGVHVRLFSRHMLDMTNQFQDVVKCIFGALRLRTSEQKCTSFVIDAEIVGVESEGRNTRLLPFQDLSTRRKKEDDGCGIRVKVFAFDLMFLNGESYVNEQLFRRRSLLQDLFTETRDFAFVSSKHLLTYNENEVKSYLSEAIEGGAEGLMVKLMGQINPGSYDPASKSCKTPREGASSLYEAGTRSHSWLKVKRDYVAGFSDTIDVVPIGAWWGTGRKAQKSFLSPILLAIYDDEEDVFRSICRCMSFTDAMYESIREFYFNGTAYPSDVDSQLLPDSSSKPEGQNATGCLRTNDYDFDENHDHNPEMPSRQTLQPNKNMENSDRVHCLLTRPSSAFVITNESPPIWFKPMEVFEVAFADLSLSRQHTAAAGLVDEEGRGVALRFPRFKRRRPDKRPEQATTSIEIAHLFAKQSKVKSGSKLLNPN